MTPISTVNKTRKQTLHLVVIAFITIIMATSSAAVPQIYAEEYKERPEYATASYPSTEVSLNSSKKLSSPAVEVKEKAPNPNDTSTSANTSMSIVLSSHPMAYSYIRAQREELIQKLTEKSIAENRELRKSVKERQEVIERANQVPKHTVPFHPDAKRNAGNRYSGWLNADRDIKSISSPRAYAAAQIEERELGWENWACLDRLWWHESNWRYDAGDSSGKRAYGIPQSAPGSKMSSVGEDWQTNPATQIDWGLDYIENNYRTPCNAWSFWADQAAFGDHGWGWY